MVTRSSVAATQEGKVAVVYVCVCGASCCRQLAGKNLHCCCVLWMRCDASTWRSRRACEQRALNHRRAARGRVVECGETVSAKRKSGLTAPTQQAKRNVCDRGSCFSTVKSYFATSALLCRSPQEHPDPPSPYVSSEGSDRPRGPGVSTERRRISEEEATEPRRLASAPFDAYWATSTAGRLLVAHHRLDAQRSPSRGRAALWRRRGEPPAVQRPNGALRGEHAGCTRPCVLSGHRHVGSVSETPGRFTAVFPQATSVCASGAYTSVHLHDIIGMMTASRDFRHASMR